MYCVYHNIMFRRVVHGVDIIHVGASCYHFGTPLCLAAVSDFSCQPGLVMLSRIIGLYL